MAFSDGQIRRLRTRLGYYQKHQGRKEFGVDMPWKTVVFRISIKTDITISDERLRQFVDGVPVKRGSKERRFPVLQQRWLEAVRDFLMHKDVAYLGAHEMEPEPSAHFAAFSLSDYMNHAAEDVATTLQGDFVRIREESDEIVESRLYIGGAPESPVLLVTETEHRYRAFNPKAFAHWTESDRSFLRRQKRELTGWAVPGAEGTLFFFLAHKENGRYSHSYFSLALNSSSNDRLGLLRYPFADLESSAGLGHPTRDSNEIAPQLVASVVLFERDGARAASDSM